MLKQTVVTTSDLDDIDCELGKAHACVDTLVALIGTMGTGNTAVAVSYLAGQLMDHLKGAQQHLDTLMKEAPNA